MQNGDPNGFTEHFHPILSPQPDHINEEEPGSPSRVTSLNGQPHHIAPIANDIICADENYAEPPAKKRKLTDPATRQRSASRPISPPWKRVTVEGPTSFVEGGRRKSSRTNAVPLELRPQAEKRQTRATNQQTPTAKSKYGSMSAYKPSPLTPASTQSAENSKRPSSSGKLSISTSPAKIFHQKSTVTQANGSIPPPKRSHKKKIPQEPPLLLPQGESSPQTRKSARAPRSIVKKEKTLRTSVDLADDTGRFEGPTEDQVGSEDNDDEEEEEEEGEGEGTEEEEDAEKDEAIRGPNWKPPRLNLRVRLPSVTIHHPEHIPPVRKFPSFQEWVQQADPLVGDETGRLTATKAKHEARKRQRIIDAARQGGLLSEGACSIYMPRPQSPPPRQYTHQDHLVAHALYFNTLLKKEQREHTKVAKMLGNAAVAVVKQRRPKTKSEIEAEQQEAVKVKYKQVRVDLMQKWEIVINEVERQRLQKWEEEQQAQGKQVLDKVLEQSSRLLEKRRRRATSDPASSETIPNIEDQEVSGGTSGAEPSSAENDENMSSSQSSSDEGPLVDTPDDDDGLPVEQLRQKYLGLKSNFIKADPHDRKDIAKVHEHALKEPTDDPKLFPDDEWYTREPERIGDSIELDEIDGTLIDDTDASTDMDDDMGESDEDSEGSEEEDKEEEESDGGDLGLLGFIPINEYQINGTESCDDDGLDTVPTAHRHTPEYEVEGISLIPDATQVQTPAASNGDEPEIDISIMQPHPSANTLHGLKDASNKFELVGGVSKVDRSYTSQLSFVSELTSLKASAFVHQHSLPSTPVSSPSRKTPVPSLLRGTLREYQHDGLDWLASLYKNNANGILADEMGLGKTIQTISLLAHLAVEHEIWGPHLIVVPASVMLNWEVEFKKFLPGFKILTYYGNQEDRRQKRKGWMDNDKWHVCITSYDLAINDKQTFKKKAWHYMVLDEAHSIKNYRSERFQTLLNFRSRSRLLLTGTPLQNNLTELWALLQFLMQSEGMQGKLEGFEDLQQFTQWFRKPVEHAFEHGRETMDNETRMRVSQLHTVLRPYLLRRLKADVEKQMPAKYEHVVYCKLSKRQRYLYDGFMSRAQTRATLASGNYFSIIDCLMQLRKVCNHPDLFETRQIVTSYAMPRAAIADFEIKELLIRRRLLDDNPMSRVDLTVVNLRLPRVSSGVSALATIQNQRLGALHTLRQLSNLQCNRVDWNMPNDNTSIGGTLASMENTARISIVEDLRHCAYLTSLRSQARPLYSPGLLARLTIDLRSLPIPPKPKHIAGLADWYSGISPAMTGMVKTLQQRSESLKSAVQRFACITPAVAASDLVPLTLSRQGVAVIRDAQQSFPSDAFHEARMCLSIAFPDKRLLQYDCGKLQSLAMLLRRLQVEGHRALIFTQMKKVLDILEQFLNIHGHRYLRLDGSTKIEHRQMLTERFNTDNRILAFILSSRAGGLGINLTGADTVIFYDSDWNPAMDKQCQDRCHRIGQTRDVHIYRLVSEYTIEVNILKKANQKTNLDDIIIQKGDFTTDHFNRNSPKDIIEDEDFDRDDADFSAAIERVWKGGQDTKKLFEQVEDSEDIVAARAAEQEVVQADAADFNEQAVNDAGDKSEPDTPGESTSHDKMTRPTNQDARLGQAGRPDVVAEVDPGHIDDYFMRFIEWQLKDILIVPPIDKSKKRNRKGGDHRIRNLR